MEKVRVAFMVVFMVAIFVLAVQGVHADRICNVSMNGLKACKPVIRNGSPANKPIGTCCSALENADFDCLCQYKDSYMLKAMEINSTRALALPQMCGITTEPYQCQEAQHALPNND